MVNIILNGRSMAQIYLAFLSNFLSVEIHQQKSSMTNGQALVELDEAGQSIVNIISQ
jgi:hypothetical protein